MENTGELELEVLLKDYTPHRCFFGGCLCHGWDTLLTY